MRPNFLKAEAGAVTVDWVVLTAALVGLGLATMGVVSSGVQDASGDVEATLSGDLVGTSFMELTGWEYAAIDQSNYDNHLSQALDPDQIDDAMLIASMDSLLNELTDSVPLDVQADRVSRYSHARFDQLAAYIEAAEARSLESSVSISDVYPLMREYEQISDF